MYTILQDSNNNLQLPFKGDFLYLLIVFTYRNKSVTAIFQNNSGVNCDYEINIIEVGSDGIVDVNNGQIKLSPRGTWKAKIYGQQDNINLAPENATLLYEYDFQVKGESCKVYPTDVKGCPDARIIVENQDGDILADETLASGETEIIVIDTGGTEPLYAYNYPGLNTGQDVIYSVGDDKWVRDNVFNPEINLWPTDRPWVFPVLDSNDTTLLLRGATPSGNNIFGNKERFTDVNGVRWVDSVTNYIIDHFTGLAFTPDDTPISASSWINVINQVNDYVFNNKSDYFTPNIKILRTTSLYNSFVRFLIRSNGAGLYSSTTSSEINSFTFIHQNGVTLSRNNSQNEFSKTTVARTIPFRKAFTYDPLQDTTKLILS